MLHFVIIILFIEFKKDSFITIYLPELNESYACYAFELLALLHLIDFNFVWFDTLISISLMNVLSFCCLKCYIVVLLMEVLQ